LSNYAKHQVKVCEKNNSRKKRTIIMFKTYETTCFAPMSHSYFPSIPHEMNGHLAGVRSLFPGIFGAYIVSASGNDAA
jgi:hypothetical protein